MKKLDLKNLNPSTDGITLENDRITVKGYNLEDKIQRFYNTREEYTTRVQGIIIEGKHYLVYENDYIYDEELLGDNQNIPRIRQAYHLIAYDENTAIATGERITTDQNFLDKIARALAEDI